MDLRKRLKQTPEEYEQEQVDAVDPFQVEEEIPVETLGTIKARPPEAPKLTPEQQLRQDILARNQLADEMAKTRSEQEAAGAKEINELEDNYQQQARSNALARGFMGAGDGFWCAALSRKVVKCESITAFKVPC